MTPEAADTEDELGEGAIHGKELRTLVVAPMGHDGPLTSQFLTAAGLDAESFPDTASLYDEVLAGCGVIVLAEEVLDRPFPEDLAKALELQPPWSDVPIVIVTSNGRLDEERGWRSAIFGSSANITLLERPLRPAILVSAVDSGLRARRRQYQVRDLLQALRAARDTAESANLAKDDFLAALSHELRTPLNPVLLVASEAAHDPRTPPALRQDFEMIAHNVGIEARLIDDLLDLTRITRGKVALELQRQDVHAILRDALTAVEEDVEARRLRLSLDLGAQQREVLADRVRLQQVFWNVLKNAVKFTPEQGTIAITTSNTDGATIRLGVSDSGIGMTAEEIEAAFDAFAQGEHASRETKQRFGGLGLGLTIARKLLELQGGTIRAASPGRGCGSTLWVELPLADARDAASATPDAAESDASSSSDATGDVGPTNVRSILLVEDHEPTRASLARLLRRRGYVVTPAGSVAEASAAARGRRFDLLISDLGLPDGNGCELAARFQDRFDHRIALSGYGMEDDVARSRQAGFSRHLVKPLTIQTLDLILSELFGASTSRPNDT